MNCSNFIYIDFLKIQVNLRNIYALIAIISIGNTQARLKYKEKIKIKTNSGNEITFLKF